MQCPVRAEPSSAPSGDAVGLFFSFGLDSFYTLLRNMRNAPVLDRSITHLILIHGFDMRPGKKSGAVFPAVRKNAARLATETQKELVVVHTNARGVIERYADWSSLGHGACLAAIGLSLEQLFSQISIAATFSYDYLPPYGSHPILDPLWSTERITFVHDGCEASRGAKASLISESPIAMETLRVCQMLSGRANPSDYNCGACDKCLRTMLAFYLVGASETCRTLPNIVRAEQLRRLRMKSDADLSACRGVIARLGSSELDVAIKAYLNERLETAMRRRTADPRPSDAASKPEESARLSQEVASLREQVARLEAQARDRAALRKKLDRARRQARRIRASKAWRLATGYRRARARIAALLQADARARSRT